MWTFLAVSFLLFSFGLGIVPPLRRATVCNGHAEFCNRSYGNITYLASHDSFAISDKEIILSRNQEVSLREQLDSGVRMLQAQAHKNLFGSLHFCHTNCFLFDGGSVEDYLKDVKEWLDDSPNEVLTLLFTNPENNDLLEEWKPAFDNAGITPMTFVPPNLPMKKSDWPTLGEMIDSGKRVVVFMDSNADPSVVDFILPEFDMIWEPPFSSTDPDFPCKVDRIGGDISVADHMYMLNHNLNIEVFDIDELLVPDFIHIEETNGLDSIMNDANGCIPVSESNSNPNFVMLDFLNKGEGLKAVNQLNGV